MRFKRIWKRGEDAYNWRVNRRARRFIYATGGSNSQSCLVTIIVIVVICALIGGLFVH